MFKTIKPITPSLRSFKVLLKPKLGEKKWLKNQSLKAKPRTGRNNKGHITSFHKGGGHKRVLRLIDLARINSQGVVLSLDYDPYRKAFIAQVYNKITKNFYYILAPKNLNKGSFIVSGPKAQIRLGNALPFYKIPVGMLIHNVSKKIMYKGQYARSAGSYSQLIQKTKDYARIRLSSGEQRLIPIKALASLGIVSNQNVKLETIGKAGRSRWKNRRPRVRGVAMNPIDHPHGGGEGKTSGGRPSVTPWGKPTKGSKTSRLQNPMIIVPANRKLK
uniref:50S ribosomal protein L2 n=1 Tax=Vischeria punctata TaxID=643629 RepID=UPI0021ABC82F|nr:50S ribosomal protein L2 [Vischeria punctata]UUA03895.1 50S ribosomal protein L2 [Vischeria punctata]